MKIISIIYLLLILNIAIFAQQRGRIYGEVLDSKGASIVGAEVTITDSSGKKITQITDKNGNFSIADLEPGSFSIKVTAQDFNVFEYSSLLEKTRPSQFVKVVLEIKGVNESVNVSNQGQVSNDSANNADAVILNEKDLAALPDDPAELEAALRTLAGDGAGLDGGQIYIDGMLGARVPPKESIREIRINSDPFSAEYESVGFGRVEVFTKPGASKWQRQAFFSFNDAAFNARNPFSERKTPSQLRFLLFYLSGPVLTNKLSFTLNSNLQNNFTGNTIFANVLDSNFNIVRFNKEFKSINDGFFINPRFDYQINKDNILTVNYNIQKNKIENNGGGFSLQSQAIKLTTTEQSFQLSETYFFSANTINEFRFLLRQNNSEQEGDNSIPRIIAQGAFVAGGTPFGLNFTNNTSWQIQNYVTTLQGKKLNHNIKLGVKIQGINIKDRNDSDFNGTYVFTGFLSPAANNPYDLDGNGIISSIEQYRAKVLGETNSLYNPSQFTLSAGNPESRISQSAIGLFVKDEWGVSPKLTFSYGVRYENQLKIKDNFNFAPRLGFAYSLYEGSKWYLKSVIRGGFGIFYSRLNNNIFLESDRFDGIRQKRFIVDNNNKILGQPVFTLNGVTNSPTAEQLASLTPLSNTPHLISPELQSPYSMQGALNFEKQLPNNSMLTITYFLSRNLHLLRSRNINAPVCSLVFTCPLNNPAGIQNLRPDPSKGNIYFYESSGYSNEQRLAFIFRSVIGKKVRLTATYTLAKSKGISDGFPAYSHDLRNEYGYVSNDIRHTFSMIGSIQLPYGVTASPLITFRSGIPFNIISGNDSNSDSLYNERPSFGELQAACNLLGLRSGWCDTSAFDSNATIPWNFGRGPSRFAVNLSFDKSISFGKTPVSPNTQQRAANSSQRKPYSLILGVRFRNLLNTNNKNNPVGNLKSPLFGQSTNSVGSFGQEGLGSRAVDIQLRFTF